MCGSESYAALAVEYDAYARAIDRKRERELNRGTCGTCSKFRPIPANGSNEKSDGWGFCIDVDEYVDGDETARESACEGEAYDSICW